MTRINVGVDPSELTREHLIAEHREITRIPNCVRRGRFSLSGTPANFKLGEGHVKFFYCRLLYLYKRYNRIYNECIRRGYNVSAKHNAFTDPGIDKKHWNDYTPTHNDRQLILERINERLEKRLHDV